LRNETKVRVSKFMSYVLRHNPGDLKISPDGFVQLNELISLMQKRYRWLSIGYLKRIVREDEKNRFEIRGDRIRARYGHSIEVSLGYPVARVKLLYHGTSPEAAEAILEKGLTPMERRKVHLSSTVEDALEVGKRKAERPVILRIYAARARETGVTIEKATGRLFLADYIPAEFISKYP